jgi:hypothetical protein
MDPLNMKLRLSIVGVIIQLTACLYVAAGHFFYKGCFLKFGVEVGVGESIEIAPLV